MSESSPAYRVVCDECGGLEAYAHESAAETHRTAHHDVRGHRARVQEVIA